MELSKHQVYHTCRRLHSAYPRCTGFLFVVVGYAVALAVAALSAQVVH